MSTTMNVSSQSSDRAASHEDAKDFALMPHRLTIDSVMLDRVNTALDHIRAGKMVILVDDEDRENEGDL